MPGRHSRSKKRDDGSRKSRDSSRRRRRDSPHSCRDDPRNQALDTILARLDAIEDRFSATSDSVSILQGPARDNLTPPPAATRNPGESVPNMNTTDKIVSALSALVQAKPTHYYISNFDPNIHDFDVWCAEVDRGRELNGWDDRECLSRIGSCLKGDARTWLNDWVSSDRSWSNFKLEFRSLCPRTIDVASILFDVMSRDCKSFATYAEYARKSLLRLNIVKGLSDDLKTAIIIRGITDPQVKAAASNAKLQLNQLVEFLSVYAKPKAESRSTHNPARSSNERHPESRKRSSSKSDKRCFNCDAVGHTKLHCPKQKKTESIKSNTVSSAQKKSSLTCTHCKKAGHTVDRCFAKQRAEAESKNATNVNFCRSLSETVII